MIIKSKQTKYCCHCKQIKPITEFYKNHKTKEGYSRWCASCNRAYSQSTKGRVAKKRHNIKRRKYYPNQVKAMNTVNNAIRDGRLVRPDSLQCYYCPAQAKQYHHHKGYKSKHWLDVIPTCIKRHREIHSGNQTVSCEK